MWLQKSIQFWLKISFSDLGCVVKCKIGLKRNTNTVLMTKWRLKYRQIYILKRFRLFIESVLEWFIIFYVVFVSWTPFKFLVYRLFVLYRRKKSTFAYLMYLSLTIYDDFQVIYLWTYKFLYIVCSFLSLLISKLCNNNHLT